jgi:heat-inducible transcriptional repressor
MTPRQRKLLQAIINEFIESAEAVGSVNLVNKYHLDVSSATIRNEMAELVRQGFLAKTHSSAGRIPTTLGYKAFVDDLLDSQPEDDERMNIAVSTLIREELFRNRFDLDDLIYSALEALVEQTRNVAMAVVNGRVYHAGLARVPNMPEFKQVQGLCNLISIIEDRITLREILTNNYEGHKVRILFGADTGQEVFHGMSIIYARVTLYNGMQGFIGVIGSERMNYSAIVPIVDYIARTSERVVGGWS